MAFEEAMKKFIYPTAVLSGSIGVGFLSLPYVAMKAGLWLTLFYLVAMAGIMVCLNLMFVEISLKTPDFKRFPGFAKKHLGNWGGTVAVVNAILGSTGVLLAYLIVGGEFLTSALQPIFGGNNLTYTLAYFCVAVILISIGIKAVAKIELISISLLFAAIIFIAMKGAGYINFGNFLNFETQISNLFLPYGPLLFSLWGVHLIPETEEMLRGNKKLLKRVIIAGTLLPATIYALFILLVLSITGSSTTEIAFIGLKNFFGNGAMTFALLVGAFVTFVAFNISGLTFKKVLNFDLKIKNWQAIVISCFMPMILFLLGIKSFLPLVAFLGGALVGIDGILILLMYRKIRGKNKAIYFLSLIFILGIIYQIIYYLA